MHHTKQREGLLEAVGGSGAGEGTSSPCTRSPPETLNTAYVIYFPTLAPSQPFPIPLLGTGLVKSLFPFFSFFFSFFFFWFYGSESLGTGKPTHSLDLSFLPKQTAPSKDLKPALLPPPVPAPHPTKQKRTHRGCGGCCRHTLVYNRESKYIISLGMVLAKNLQLALFHVTWSNLCMYTE